MKGKYIFSTFTIGLSIALLSVMSIGDTPKANVEYKAIEPTTAPITAPTATPTPRVIPTATPKPVKEFQKVRCKITAYCIENYPHRCNNGDSSTTATGAKPIPGVTVAVDPNVIPYNSNVIINGHTYIANDTGGAIKGNRVDIVFATHQEALNFGVQYADVYWVK